MEKFSELGKIGDSRKTEPGPERLLSQQSACPCKLGLITSTEKVTSMAYACNHGAGERETRESLGLIGHPVFSVRDFASRAKMESE